MNITRKTLSICSIFVCVLAPPSYGQLLLQDDFKNESNEWFWREDGNQSIPTVHDGLLHLKLINAISSEYCNTEIYNDPILNQPTPEPYSAGTEVRIRLKTSEIHTGSRGWGFWDGYLDTLSLLFDYDVAWVMQQGSYKVGEDYNWFSFGSNRAHLYQRQIFTLDNEVIETNWNTYKIRWEENKIIFSINGKQLFETSEQIPNQNMRMDVWIDNRVINLSAPGDFTNNDSDFSEMFVDFVEISGVDGVSIPREIGSNVLIWDTPNSFPNGERNHLWKQYNFNLTNDSETLIFLTGSAESYNGIDFTDELKIMVDNSDDGWNNTYSLNGNDLNGKGKSIVLSANLTKGNHKIDIYTNTTPFLRDFIVVSKDGGKNLFAENYNETAKVNSGLWKTINFTTTGINDITLLVSGTGDKNQAVRFEIDEKDYGWGKDYSIDGNELNGTPNTVVINDFLEEGSHQIKIYNKGAAQIYSIAAYVSPKTTSITKTKIPDEDIILRASPNPFNNSTIINYQTNKTAQNQISVYNILGQRVETLVNKIQQAGDYNLTWNASGQTSGIYICILESDNYFKVEKLLLLK